MAHLKTIDLVASFPLARMLRSLCVKILHSTSNEVLKKSETFYISKSYEIWFSFFSKNNFLILLKVSSSKFEAENIIPVVAGCIVLFLRIILRKQYHFLKIWIFFFSEFAITGWTCSRSFCNSKCSSGRVDLGFDNLAEIFPLKVQKGLQSYIFTILFPKMFVGHKERTFDNPGDEILLRVRKVIVQLPKKYINL